AAQPLQFYVSSSTPCLTTAPLELEITADGGYHEVRTLPLLLESDQAGTDVVCDATAACTPLSVGGDLPGETRLSAPRPSPTRGPAWLSYAIAPGEAGRVSVRVYDVAGRMVRSLFDGERGAGRYEERWDGTDAGGTPVRG